MPNITCQTGWMGASINGKWSNHESNMTEADMIALAALIANIPGMSGAAVPGMDASFAAVRTVMASVGDNLVITKGIHERNTKVHFDIQIAAVAGTFHVFLTAGVVSIHTGAATNNKVTQRKLAPYVPSGLSIKTNGIIQTFPALIPLATLEQPFGRPRGYSFNVGNSTAVATGAEVVSGISDFHRRIAA